MGPEFPHRRLASVMMDALYAAHPAAWIDHGGRGPDGVRWWDRYTGPAPQRNIHNRPPRQWAKYFNALKVATQRAKNAYHNELYGLDGHRAAEYRYGERLEDEALENLPAFQEAGAQGPDPASSDGVTHVVFRVRLAAGQEVPAHDLRATWLRHIDSPGIEVELTGMSWRSTQTPWVTHEAGFTPPLDAAIEPAHWRSTSAQYTACYDELLPGQRPRRTAAQSPFAGREAEITAMAARLMKASHRRGADRPPPPLTGPEGFEDPQMQQQNASPSQQSPRLR